MQDQSRVGRLRALELLLFVLYRDRMRIITFLLLLPTLSLASDDAQRRFEQLTAVVQSIRGDGPRVFYESEPNDENFIATPVLVPAKVLAQLESADDVDWFEIRTANQNQMIDIVFSTMSPTNPNATWQVEWFGPICGSSDGDVTLSRRNISADSSPFAYSIPTCKAAVYKVEVRSTDPSALFYDKASYSLNLSYPN